jgi:hypothetical protein
MKRDHGQVIVVNIVAIGSATHASYSILRYYYADMDNDIEGTKEDSKKPSQRGDDNKNQRVNVSRDIKKRIDEGITKTNIEGDPTRSDE